MVPRSWQSNRPPICRRVAASITTFRPGEALQPGRPVRRLANRRLLADAPRANRLADDHKAGGDANADLQRLRRHRCLD